MTNYYAHKTVTILLEMFGFSVAAITIFIEQLDTGARFVGALVAIVIGICAVIRAVVEIKIKRSELRLKKKQEEIHDQILWREVATNKQLQENGNNPRKSLPSDRDLGELV